MTPDESDPAPIDAALRGNRWEGLRPSLRALQAIGRTRSTAAAVAVAAAAAVAACGDDDFANEPRAPARVTLSTAVTPSAVTVAPSRVGAGPIELLAANLTSRSQRLTLRRQVPGGGTQPLTGTGPIDPGATASLTADLPPGTYRVTAGARAIAPATIRVGPRRPSAQDRLLQP